MKKFIGLALLLCLYLAPARAMSGPAGRPGETNIQGPYDCTVSARVYLITEAGVIGVGLSITAGTCSEAYQGISQAISGFLRAF